MKLRAALMLCLAAAWFALVGPPASADAYPPTVCATISVSTTTPLPGQAITVHGVNFVPDASIRLELRSTTHPLKTVKADADGSFTTTVTMPAGVSGHHLLVAVGGNPGDPSCPADPIQVLQIGGTTSGPGGGGTSGGGTAFTGTDVVALLAAAGVLVAAGVLLNRGGKRRRRGYAGKH